MVGLTRYRATVAYCGTAYYGFQRQIVGQPTIQSQLEEAISQIVSRPVTVIGAGRTDSGVHALGQVVAFDLVWSHSTGSLLRAINAHLPTDIAVLELQSVSPIFHPRYDALSRTYEYHIYNFPTRHPLQQGRSWHVPYPIDLTRLNEAAAILLGVHNFATFGQAPQGDNTVREVFRAEWRAEKVLFIFTIEANAFLYRMVRSLVGTLKAVGEGSWTLEEFRVAFAANNRQAAANTAPADGLYLLSVNYNRSD